MSYDLTIRADETYSRSAPVGPLMAFIAKLPDVKANGDRGFVLDDPPERWMEIDLEVVSEEGDSIEEDGERYEAINCIRLHIPYPFLGDAIDLDYLPTAHAVASHLGWSLYDEQTGEYLSRTTDSKPPRGGKPWWKFW